MQQAVLIDHTAEATRTPENGARVVKCEIVPINGHKTKTRHNRRRIVYCVEILQCYELVFTFAFREYTEAARRAITQSIFDMWCNFSRETMEKEQAHALRILSECKTTEAQAQAYTIFLHLGQLLPEIFTDDIRQGRAKAGELRAYLSEAKKAAALLVLEYKEPKPIL